MRKPKYKPTRFMAKGSHYDKAAADFAVRFVESLKHTKGRWHGKAFELIGWQEEIIRDLFGILKKNGYRQFNMAYIEIPKKQGKSELAAAIALMCVGIIFKGKFPETEVSRNENMKKLGIKCMREQEEEIKSCTGKYSEDCVGCGFYNNKEK